MWSASPVGAAGFDCVQQHCNLQGDNSYPYLVLGTVAYIGSGQSSETVFRAARAQGWWKSLPDDAVDFAKNIRPILIHTHGPKGAIDVTMLMSDEEFQSAPLNVGDFVRYSPHDKAHEAPRENTPTAWAYWKLIGCIQVLCRQSDRACPKRYRAGVYAVDTGIPLDVRSLKPLSGSPAIDPVTYFPRSGVSSNHQ
jgi:hypothetical protein